MLGAGVAGRSEPDGHRLYLRILLQRVFPHLPSDSRLLEAAERGCCIENVEAVYPDCASHYVVCSEAHSDPLDTVPQLPSFSKSAGLGQRHGTPTALQSY